MPESNSIFGAARSNNVKEYGLYYFYTWILISFLTCLTIHHVISPKLFMKYCESYRKLKKAKQMEWDSRIVSSLHASVVSLLSLYALICEPEMWTNRIEHLSVNGCTALSITVGYFLCDMISMPLYWRGASLIIFLIHHGFSAAAFLYSINIQMTSFYCVIRLISEMSTPFTNQRWLFLTAGLTHGHKRVAISTLVFAFTFSIVRNWIIIPYWIMVYFDFNTPAYHNTIAKNPNFNYVWLGCAAILDILNVYWSFGVYRSGRKALQTISPMLSFRMFRPRIGAFFSPKNNNIDDTSSTEEEEEEEVEIEEAEVRVDDTNQNKSPQVNGLLTSPTHCKTGDNFDSCTIQPNNLNHKKDN